MSDLRPGDVVGLRQQRQAFETRYSLETPQFYARFLRGEMGDNGTSSCDWAVGPASVRGVNSI